MWNCNKWRTLVARNTNTTKPNPLKKWRLIWCSEVRTRAPPTAGYKNKIHHNTKNCQANGFPTPRVAWVIVIMPFPVGKTAVKAGWPHYLTITSLHRVDSRFYRCVAKKPRGNKKGPHELVEHKVWGLCRFAYCHNEDILRMSSCPTVCGYGWMLLWTRKGCFTFYLNISGT